MTAASYPYADGDFVGQPSEQPPQGPPPLRRERCAGAGMVPSYRPHPSLINRTQTVCPLCELPVEPLAGRTPEHYREAPRG